MNKLRNAALVSLPVIAAGYLWFGHQPKTASAHTELVRPTILVAPGRVEPVRDPVSLAFETGGRIVAIEVDEGQAVAANQVVARLDDRLATARVAGAEAAVAAARARLSLARRGPRHEDVEAARADAAAAEAAAEHRSAEQARSERLGQLGAVASASVDADSAAARIAVASAAAASARYRSLAKGTRAEQIAEAAAALDLANAELDVAKIALDQTVLRAPHDGIVLRRLAEVGALVTAVAPSPVITVADVSRLEIRAEVDEADVAAIALGKSAYATADAFGDRKFPVRIARITHELGRKSVRDDDPRARVDTRVLEVIAAFDGTPQGQYEPASAGERDRPALPLGLRMYVHLDK